MTNNLPIPPLTILTTSIDAVTVMQVEEYSESQFVDYTSATDYERFISSIESLLNEWNLRERSHISQNIITHAPTLNVSDRNSITSARSVSLRYSVLQYDESSLNGANPLNKTKCFLLLTCSQLPRNKLEDSEVIAYEQQESHWRKETKHFTPTMLSIANSTLYPANSSIKSVKGPVNTSFSDNSGKTEMYAEVEVFHETDDGQDFWNISYRQLACVIRQLHKWFGVREHFLLFPIDSLSNALMATITKEGSEIEIFLDESAIDKPCCSSELLFHMHLRKIDTYEANQILSAMTLALTNMNCTLPAFIPIGNYEAGQWVGASVPGSTDCMALYFETQKEEQFWFPQSGISALLDYFRAKVGQSTYLHHSRGNLNEIHGALQPGMQVSVWQKFKWTPTDENFQNWRTNWRCCEWLVRDVEYRRRRQLLLLLLFGDRRDNDQRSLPYWGASYMPIKSLEAMIAWKDLEDGTFVDNAVYSTLSTLQAHEWWFQVIFDSFKTNNERKPQLPLSKLLANLTQAYAKARDLGKDVLVTELAPPTYQTSRTNQSADFDHEADEGSGDELLSFTQSIPAVRAASLLGNALGSLTSIVSAATWKGTDKNKVREIVANLFDTDIVARLHEQLLHALDSTYDFACTEVSEEKHCQRSALPRFRSTIPHSSPPVGIVSILACRMGLLQGVNAMSLLWMEFVRSLRVSWTLKKLVPFSEAAMIDGACRKDLQNLNLEELRDMEAISIPDFDCCLLHQKLQLLNCCVLREHMVSEIESVEKTILPTTSSTSELYDDDSKSDDEYFDSLENKVEVCSMHCDADIDNTLKMKNIIKRSMPRGLIPVTEDTVSQCAHWINPLMSLMPSLSSKSILKFVALKSEMYAFKEINPEATLADFLQCYSPEIWITSTENEDLCVGEPTVDELKWFADTEEFYEHTKTNTEQYSSTTSKRAILHRLWDQCDLHDTARPRFDPQQEAEKVFHYLETISPHEMLHQMLVAALGSCAFTLTETFTMMCMPPNQESSSMELPTIIRSHLEALHSICNQAVRLLDAAFTESQTCSMQLSAQESSEEARQRSDTILQISFQMALDACWKCVSVIEDTESICSEALGLMHLFHPPNTTRSGEEMSQYWAFVESILRKSHACSPSVVSLLDSDEVSKKSSNSEHVYVDSPGLRSQIASLMKLPQYLSSPGEKVQDNSLQPYQREYVIRSFCHRPYHGNAYDSENIKPDKTNNLSLSYISAADRLLRDMRQSPILVNRMYASFTDDTVRFALSLTESEF